MREVLEFFKKVSTVKRYLTQPQFLTLGTNCQFCSSGRKQGIVRTSLFKNAYLCLFIMFSFFVEVPNLNN